MNYSDLDAVFRQFQSVPPRFAVDPVRQQLLLQMDELLSEADSETDFELGRFYRERVDQIIREVKAYTGDAPRLWKLYSSGFLLKDRGRVTAIDINGGCTPDSGRTRMILHEAQFEALSDIIDEYYNTHSHRDHISADLCDLLAAKGKLIVMPQEAIRRWLISGAVPAEEFSAPHVNVFVDYQGTDAKKRLRCAMYLFTLSNGKTIFWRGDIYHQEGFSACLDMIDSWGKTVDYASLTPYYSSGEAPVDILARKYSCCFLNCHEWEFSHRRFGITGPATQCFEELYEKFAVPYQDNRVLFLFWGESTALG